MDLLAECNIRLLASKKMNIGLFTFKRPVWKRGGRLVKRVVQAWKGGFIYTDVMHRLRINDSVRLDLWQKGSSVRCCSY